MKNWMSTLVLGGTLAMSGYALAEKAPDAQNQTANPQGQMGQQQAVDTDFDDSELKTFVDVQKDIGKVRNEYVQKIQGVEDEEKAKALQKEARDSLIEVVEKADLSVEKYNRIAQAYQTSPEIREKVNQMVQQ